MRSIEARLRWRLLVGSLALSAVLALIAWAWSGRQVRELLDYQLEQVARALVDHDFTRSGELDVEDPAMHLDIVVWDPAGRLLYRSSPELELRPDTPLGFSRVHSGSQPDAVLLRLFTLRSEQRIVQVAHPVGLRQDLALDAGLEVLAAALAGTAALSLLLLLTVRRSLAPLRELGRELSRRDAGSLSPIDLPDVPAELQAPLAMLNALLARLQASLALHRQFIADAAHELRTPLAALKLQAQSLERADNPEARKVAVARLTAGIDRATRLVEQLLVLARQEASATAGAIRQEVDLAELARRSVADLAAAAQAKGVDLGVQRADAVRVQGQPDALNILLRNLVENAVKYTPQGGTVDISVRGESGGAVLVVEDSGPGIAPEERERVFDRFYRIAGSEAQGSGLGLAIIKSIAERHGARLELGQSDRLGGLAATVSFPAA